MLSTRVRPYFSFAPGRQNDQERTLVLLNSLGTTTAIWDELLPDLLRLGDVVRLDYPGHGLSSHQGLPATISDLVDDVTDVMDHIGVAEGHLIGVSIGGMIALSAAAHRPERVHTVTAIGSSPTQGAALWDERQRIVQRWGTAAILPEVLRRWFTDEYRATHPAVVEAYAGLIRDMSDSAYAHYSGLMSGLDMREDLSAISARALLIAGECDAAATPEDVRDAGGRLNKSEVVVIERAAHLLQAMAGDRIVELVARHVRGY